MGRDNTKGKIQRTILHYLSWRGMAASLAMAALPATAAEPDSLAIDTMSYDLGDVTVTAQRKLVKNDIDKLTYDVANDETARTKNTLDMLRSVPLVTIDGQENISIKGSPSFKVYRNGHPDPTLSSQNLKDVLKSIPASQIKKVEVITDPGAKEDAEGTQYILNLVMQNNSHLAGVTGTVSANYNPLRQGPGMGTMLTIQKGKFATSINYGYQHDKKDQGNDATRQYLKTDQTMESRLRNTTMTNVHYGNISASYEVDSLNLLTLNFGGYYYNAGIGGVNGYERMTNSDGQLAYFYNVNAQLPTYYAYNFGGRLDYQHKTRKEGEVFTASYQLQTTRSHQDKTEQYLNIFNLPVSYTGYENNSRTQFDEHTFQLDYVRPLGKWFKWNAGAKYIFRTSESDVWLTYTGAEEMNQHSLFQHNTQIAAAYTEWLYSGSKIQARVGLRYEYSFLKAEYPDGSQSDFHKRLNDWVPSASVRYALTDAQSLKLSFSSNINRPGIDYLNPAEERSPNSLSYGNPGLNSSRNYNLQLEYNYITTKATWMGGVSHTFCNNQIGQLWFDQNGLSVTTYGDLLHSRSWMLWAYVQTALWRGANLGGGPNIFYLTKKDSQTGLEHSRWSSWNTINFTQKLPWKLTFGLNGGFNIGNEVESVYAYSEPSHYWYASLSRSFLKEDRLSVRLSAGNLFGPDLRSDPSHTVQGDFRGTQTWLGSQRHVGISISWRFGSLRGGVKSVDRTIENDDIVGGISTGGGNKQ